MLKCLMKALNRQTYHNNVDGTGVLFLPVTQETITYNCHKTFNFNTIVIDSMISSIQLIWLSRLNKYIFLKMTSLSHTYKLSRSHSLSPSFSFFQALFCYFFPLTPVYCQSWHRCGGRSLQGCWVYRWRAL